MSWLFQYIKSAGSNFSKVTDRLYRSAQPTAKQLVEYRDKYGIEAVLDLRDDVEDEEKKEVEDAGLLWTAVPMSDTEAPNESQVFQALQVLKSDFTTLVFCKGGRHRTGLMVAVYQVAVKGVSKKAAWGEAYKFGFYRHGGHGPIEDWFLNEFDPKRFR